MKRKLIAVAIGSFGLTTAADANANITPTVILVEIDVSDISNVTFTATTGRSLIDDTTRNQYDGISFVGILSPPASLEGYNVWVDNWGHSSNLTPRGGVPFNVFYRYNNDTRDLAIYRELNTTPGPIPDMDFVAGEIAFTGQLTHDFSAYPNMFAPVGTVGDIVTGHWKPHYGEPIGQFIIVPEPSAFALMLVGAGLAVCRRRRS